MNEILPQNLKLAEISKRAAGDLQAFIAEAEKTLLEAWSAAAQEAQDNETKAKFRLNFAVTMDLDSDKMETALTFGVRHKLSREQSIPNPDQPDLKLGEELSKAANISVHKMTVISQL